MRFPIRIIEAVRQAVGQDYPVLVKMNQTDGMSGGITLKGAVAIAKGYEKAGASALIPSAGFTSKVPCVRCSTLAITQTRLVSQVVAGFSLS